MNRLPFGHCRSAGEVVRAAAPNHIKVETLTLTNNLVNRQKKVLKQREQNYNSYEFILNLGHKVGGMIKVNF